MSNIQETIRSAYNSKDVENKWYAFWEKEGYFSPDRPSLDPLTPRPLDSFVIVIPPPNVTGSLHMGHALNNTLQDALIRFKRMQGYRALWLPGTDHAGIPTQMLVERELKKEGKTRHDIGRDALIKRVWEWKEKYGDIIINQLKQLGCSCDWTRQRFTMDEGYTKAVQEAFIHLYKKGCIYRGNRIINWCVTCRTAVSDLEMVYRETKGKLYYFRYPLIPGTGKENSAGSDPIYIVIATTRPETMLGDTAVAVNPEDERYEKYAGMKILLPLMNREIPLISDNFVDKAFGTGAVKITPFHDPNDFEAGLLHQLQSLQVIGFNGKMTDEAGKYAGMKRYECREQILKDLEEQGLVEKIEDYTHSLSCHDRCGDALEPLVSLQWFVSMKELAEPAIQCVKEKKVKFHPERFAKTYLDWMENIKDWCISRQIWWGHRIPVWYCERQGTGENGAGSDPIYTGCQPIASATKPVKCPSCGSVNLTQDEDVLDTWFSSALWPFATLGWPGGTDDLKTFYPTTTLSTARDIINLWVARMLMTGLEFMGDVPFKDVYIHPTILNEQGKRMSKSLGTGVDPLELMEKYGTDAVRFGLILNCTKGQDVRFSERMIENTRNFCTKLWNASRFVMMYMPDDRHLFSLSKLKKECGEQLAVPDRWIISRTHETLRDVTQNLGNFNFHEACRSLYEFVWGDFCDWYLEISKVELIDPNPNKDRKRVLQSILNEVFIIILKLLHPLMPFITEEIYQKLKVFNLEDADYESIMLAPWPLVDEGCIDKEAEKEMQMVQEIVYFIRSSRHAMALSPSVGVDVDINLSNEKMKDFGRKYRVVIGRLAKCGLSIANSPFEKRVFVRQILDMEIGVHIPEGLDLTKAIRRDVKEQEKLKREFLQLEARLSNEAFSQGAPPHVIESEKEKLQNFKNKIANLQERLQLFLSLR